MRKYLCLECGNNVDLKGVFVCPICNNKDKTKLLQNIEIEVGQEFVEKDNKTTYNKDIDDIYDIIINELKDHFGEQEINEWVDHICYGKPYKGEHLDYLTKKIRRYILHKVIGKNKILKELVENNGLAKAPKK